MTQDQQVNQNKHQSDEQQSSASQSTSTGKRLWQYGMLYKKTIMVALLFLARAVAAEVIGPRIAKQIIDNHVTSINRTWHYVEEGTTEAIAYRDQWLVREDKLTDEGLSLGKASFVQKGLTLS